MAKVLFVLYVPEDISTTPGIFLEPSKDVKKEDGNKVDSEKRSVFADPASTVTTGTENERHQDLNVNSQVGVTLLGTLDPKVKNEVALNITSSCKVSDSCSSVSPVQVTVSTQEKKDSSQDSFPLQVNSLMMPAMEVAQTVDASAESHLVAVAKLPELLTNEKDAKVSDLDTQHGMGTIQSETEEDESNLILRKFEVGENLTDDFWDFGPESTENGPLTESFGNQYSEKATTDASFSPETDNKDKVDKALSDEVKSAGSCGITPLTLVLDGEDKAKGATSLKKDENKNALEDLPDVDTSNASITQQEKKDQKQVEAGAQSTSGTVRGSPLVAPKEAAITNPILVSNADVQMPSEMIELVPQRPLKEKVVDCLSGLGVKNVAWARCPKDRVWQATFIDSAEIRCESILHTLEGIGLGFIKKSSISVIPISIHSEATDPESSSDGADTETEERVKQENIAEEKIGEFKKSIKSRMVVAQVVESVRSNAEFTFDYVMLVIVASMIAALGLMESSSVTLVASMLISPLMGPILAGIFGTVIKNSSLRDCGITSELYGLGIAILSGFVYGLIMACLEVSGLEWRETDKWPTDEMISRGVFRGLIVGALIALPSGAGVALSVLGGNAGSLVGVAISASLLPPAVNAGMLWSAAVVAAIQPPIEVAKNETMNHFHEWLLEKPECPELVGNAFTQIYVCNAAHDLALLGVVSLLLTIVNIICIFFMGILVLKIKEVAPRTSFTSPLKQFFRHDIKVARESYTTAKGPESAALGKKWLEEYKKLKENYGMAKDDEEENAFCKMLQQMEEDTDVEAVLGFLPKSPRTTVFLSTLSPFDPNSSYKSTSKLFKVTRVNEAEGVKMPDSVAENKEEAPGPSKTEAPGPLKTEAPGSSEKEAPKSKPGPKAGRKDKISRLEEIEPLMKAGHGGNRKTTKATRRVHIEV